MNGVDLISRERQEQVSKHGYDDDHDDDHTDGEIVCAATLIALVGVQRSSTWPWEPETLDRIKAKPRIERLAIAGALIAAEIDRELRLEGGNE